MSKFDKDSLSGRTCIEHRMFRCSDCAWVEIDSLRASNAALKAENESAVKNMAALQSELAAFKNWQPSDPGTKEAMEWARNEQNHWEEQRVHGQVLVTALTAAMVRLEEAEKKLEDAMNNRHCVHSERAQKAEALVACKEYSESLLAQRAEAAESRVAALTASLAGLRKKMGGI